MAYSLASCSSLFSSACCTSSSEVRPRARRVLAPLSLRGQAYAGLLQRDLALQLRLFRLQGRQALGQRLHLLRQ
jgi:hypothetical protein